MTYTKLSQRYDTSSRGALDVLFDVSLGMSKRCGPAHFELLEHMFCIVVAALCREPT